MNRKVSGIVKFVSFGIADVTIVVDINRKWRNAMLRAYQVTIGLHRYSLISRLKIARNTNNSLWRRCSQFFNRIVHETLLL